MDWVDKVRDERSVGHNKALTQTQHKAVNNRYPGLTPEECCKCGEYTGRAGRGEDSLYDEDDGPFCPECWNTRSEE